MWHSKILAFTLTLILSLGIMITIVPPLALTNDIDVTDGVHKLAPDVQSQMKSAKNESQNEKISIIIMLEQQPSHPSLDLKDATGQERGQIIHSMKSRTEKSQKGVLAILENQKSRGNVEDVRTFWIVNAIAVKATPEVLEELVQRPEVKLVEPDYKVKALGESLPWGVDRIDAELVWNGTEGGTDVVAGRNAGQGINVSILDTGIDYTHPDLADNVKGGHRFLGGINDDNYTDYYGHGTHCAGIVAAMDNDEGVIGTAPEVNLYGVKVLDDTGNGYASDLIKGIEWSVDNSMHIISMSLGTENYSAPLHTACNNAYSAGLLLVAAAGNDNEYGIDYPAAYETVIAVGAIDQSDARCDYPGWWGSDWGPELELTAPGVAINSTYPGGRYILMSGTSMACPHVTGAAALVWSAYPDYNNTQVRQRLQETAEDLGAPGRDDWYGYGLVDAENAATDRTPPASITNLSAIAVGETWINWTWTNPSDEDFNHTKVWLNGTFMENIYAPEHLYNATNLLPNTTYEIGTRTVDNSGNVNATWVNQTAKTMAGNHPPIASFTYSPVNPLVNQTITFNASNSTDPDGNITAYNWTFGDGTTTTMGPIVTYAFSSAGDYMVNLTVTDDYGTPNTTSKRITVSELEGLIFDTGSPANPFPSISGIHNGTITPSCNIRVSKLYTYPSPGTGGHTEYIRIWNSTGWNETATWNGYTNDWHNLSFDESFTLLENETYNYTIITGSYPQIIHEPSFNAPGGTITCTEFVDANGVVYDDWIPAIRLE